MTATPPGSVPVGVTLAAREVVVDAPDGPLDAHLVLARGTAPRPGLVVVHEGFGPNDHIRDVARRFAHLGHDVLVPDLYTRVGHPAPGSLPAVYAAMLSIADATVEADLAASLAHLRTLPASNGRVGMIGFCLGGRMTLLAATSPWPPDVAVDCWGGFVDRAGPDDEVTRQRPVPVMDRADDLGCPLFLAAGAKDSNPSPAIMEEIARRARTTGHPVRLRVYDDAGHAFFADYRDTYVPDAAGRLWADATAFLAEHLAG